jgi:hypothetical protein
MIRLHTETQLQALPRSALKVCVGGLKFSDCLWLSFSLALAKPNKIPLHLTTLPYFFLQTDGQGPHDFVSALDDLLKAGRVRSFEDNCESCLLPGGHPSKY